jgi:hypothetical protein
MTGIIEKFIPADLPAEIIAVAAVHGRDGRRRINLHTANRISGSGRLPGVMAMSAMGVTCFSHSMAGFGMLMNTFHD